jgi:hypothetical protein
MTLAIELHGMPVAGALTSADWFSERFDFWAFDRRVDSLFARGEPLHVVAAAEELPLLRAQLAIRTQRLAARRNTWSATDWFTAVLAEHHALHPLDKPLARADLDHALDAWQWTLELDPDARASVQLAALLHDIERLTSETDARVEHLADDYQAFKDAHAEAGAQHARTLLDRAGVPAAIADQTCALIAVHERTGGSASLVALNDADALSFFSLNSPGYLRYFGEDHTAAKVAYTYRRMSRAARAWLGEMRMPAFVRAQVDRCGS